MSDETMKALCARLHAIEALVVAHRNTEAVALINRLINVLPVPGENNIRCAQAEIDQILSGPGREAMH